MIRNLVKLLINVITVRELMRWREGSGVVRTVDCITVYCLPLPHGLYECDISVLD